MLNKAAWRLNDPQWVEKRAKQWLEFKAWFDHGGYWSDDWPEQNQIAYEKYYKTGEIDLKFCHWSHLCFMHPSLTEEEALYIIRLRPDNIGGGCSKFCVS